MRRAQWCILSSSAPRMKLAMAMRVAAQREFLPGLRHVLSVEAGLGP